MTDATPVALDLSPQVEPTVRRWIDRIGWQVVDAGTADLVPPVLALTDPNATTPAGSTPCVLLVSATDDPVAAAARASALGPAAVLRWPDDREGLRDIVGSTAAVAARRQDTDVLTVGGSAGGVGTTTVALALGGLASWRGRSTLVAASGHVPCPAAAPVGVDGLDGGGAWRAAAPVPGVPGLRVVSLTGGPAPGHGGVDVPGADLAVIDHGVDDDVDVLVVRRDAAGLAALGRSSCAAAVVVDVGPVPARVLSGAAGGRRVVTVPHSTRVARAALAQRVPAGLPGAWLRPLAPLLRPA